VGYGTPPEAESRVEWITITISKPVSQVCRGYGDPHGNPIGMVGMGTEIPSPRQPCSFFVVAMAHCVLMLQATAGGVAPPEVVVNEGDEQVKCYVLQSSFAH